MQRWIARRNIEEFQKLLAAETDPAKKVRYQGLLDDERRKYLAILAHAPSPANAQ